MKFVSPNLELRSVFLLTTSFLIAGVLSVELAGQSIGASAPAQVSSGANEPDTSMSMAARLTIAEKLYFGSASTQIPLNERMDRIEVAVFGRHRSGSIDKRLDRVLTALGAVNKDPSQQGGSGEEKNSLNVVAPPPSQSEALNNLYNPNRETAVGQKTGDLSVSELLKAANVNSSDKPLESKPDPKSYSQSDSKLSSNSEPKTDAAHDRQVQNLLQLGMTAHRSGQTQVAEGHFKNALAVEPRCADAFYNLGSIAEGRGDFLSALTNYRAALGINPLDKELQNAVKSVEEEVAKSNGHLKPSSVPIAPSRPRSTKGKPPSSGYTPYTPQSTSNQAFSLQTAQNNALMQTQGNYPPVLNVNQQPMPVYNVSQQPPPVANITPTPSHSTSGSLNFLQALPALHCPICRLTHMGW